MLIESFSLNRPGFTMAGEAFFPMTDRPGPLVVICHGLFSSMASEKLTALAQNDHRNLPGPDGQVRLPRLRKQRRRRRPNDPDRPGGRYFGRGRLLADRYPGR